MVLIGTHLINHHALIHYINFYKTAGSHGQALFVSFVRQVAFRVILGMSPI